jgi:FkbM family methyltransferase
VVRPLESTISAALRGRLVDRSLRFTAREWGWGKAVRSYQLRESGVQLVLQHNTPDVLVLDEIFYQRLYEPPPPVQQLLSAPLQALDAGANIGMFGVWLLGRYPGSRLISFEPDARNAEMLRRTVDANGAHDAWRVVQAAVATAPGMLGFAGSDFATSHVVADERAPQVAAVDFFEHARDAQLIKIDVEGSEWEILEDPRLAELAARALVLEYHPLPGGGDSHESAPALLGRAGFLTEPIFRTASGVGMLWAWRPNG